MEIRYNHLTFFDNVKATVDEKHYQSIQGIIDEIKMIVLLTGYNYHVMCSDGTHLTIHDTRDFCFSFKERKVYCEIAVNAITNNLENITVAYGDFGNREQFSTFDSSKFTEALERFKEFLYREEVAIGSRNN
ncbi:gp326 [Bacillus phage G]|uniref:Gp326 n=1 Tax=Bacillus phage G TaxID=2884420 RepID=G3MA67_9CAUD|nr:gp326 [Bacillus phage G]AEO93585.1 gp326 [Bacillus phage G]